MTKNSNWIKAFASVLGKSHKDTGICQDNCNVFELLDGELILAIVSDGAGSAIHSDIGSKQAIDKTYKFILDNLEEIKDKIICGDVTESEWFDFSKKVFISVNNFICNSLSVDLSYLFEKEINGNDLASTLEIGLFHEKIACFARIGDGRIGYRKKNGEWVGVLPPTKGEYANMTTFITSIDWIEDESLIGALVIKEDIDSVCLLSDGGELASFECCVENEDGMLVDKNKPFESFFNPNITTLKLMKESGLSQLEINLAWASFLDSGNNVLENEPDDKTIILITLG